MRNIANRWVPSVFFARLGADPPPFSWKELTIQCSSPDCSLRWKTQPAMLSRFRGIQFQNRWYHHTDCLREHMRQAVKQLLPGAQPAEPRPHRLPVGLLLVQRGAITAEELREGLRLQRLAGAGKLGYWLQQITHLDDAEICAVLSQQWGCPVFPLEASAVAALTDDAPPYPLLAAAKAVPAFCTTDGHQRHIAFSERVDHRLLYALEEILDCKTFPCVARDSAVKEALEEFRKHAPGDEISFDTMRDPGQIAATICSYAEQMDTREVKVVPAGGHLWVALFRNGIRKDLLFRVPLRQPSRITESALPDIKAFPEIDDIQGDGVVGAPGPL
jgi:Type II secretion system (T2SS), protein E, N-terminal domain